jgi:hypothetical protein
VTRALREYFDKWGLFGLFENLGGQHARVGSFGTTSKTTGSLVCLNLPPTNLSFC